MPIHQPRAIDVTRGLRVAAREYFAEAHRDGEQQERLERAAAGAKNADQVRAQMKPTRSLPDGYYSWIGHLIELEGQLAAGIAYTAAEIQARELRGLAALRAGRADFDRDYPGCAGCGTRNKRMTFSCRACGHQLLEKKGAR
jgi:hypothetical protein